MTAQGKGKVAAGGRASVLDRVLTFLGIQEDPAAEAQVAAAAEAPAGESRRGRLVSLPGQRASAEKLRVVVVKPRGYDEVEGIAGYLKQRSPVVVSLDMVERDLARRIVDFISGATYALDGDMRRLAENIFLFTPSNVGIDAGHRVQEVGDELV